MELKKLQTLVIDALEDVKAHDINVFDTVHLTSLFDRIVIASGTSNRQTKALAASVRDKVKAAGGQVLSMEGEDTGEWVLVDLGDIIVHIMQPAIRAYYRLEEIWGDKEVKLGAAKRTTKKDDNEEAPKRVVSRHLAASQTSVDDIAAPKKPASRKPSVKTGAEKAPAKKRAAKPPVGKTIKVAVSKSAASAKKAPAKRAPRAKVAS
ncbi:MAG: ribosome silencing factor [Glaciimonas sp.]|nr:ribosome silencing factor [Glaciimonas sp.]